MLMYNNKITYIARKMIDDVLYTLIFFYNVIMYHFNTCIL